MIYWTELLFCIVRHAYKITTSKNNMKFCAIVVCERGKDVQTLKCILCNNAFPTKSVMLKREEVEVAHVEKHFRYI